MQILSLGQKIKLLRKEKNLTLKELAANRITAAQISHIERDKSFPSQDLLEYFSEKLGTPVDYFLESKEAQARRIASSLILKSEIYYKTEQYQQAKQELAKVFNLCMKYEIPHEAAKANFVYGLIHKNEKDYKKSITQIEKALVLYIRCMDQKGTIQSYIELGTLYLIQDCYLPAINMLHQAESIVLTLDDIDIELEKSIYINLSYSYMKSNINKEAIEYAKKAQHISEKSGDIKSRGKGFFIMGNSYLQNSQFNDAKKYFNMAISCFDSEKKVIEKAKSEMLLAQVFINLGDTSSAIEHLEKALQIKSNQKDSQYVEILLNYCDLMCKLDNTEKAEEFIKEAIYICQSQKLDKTHPIVLRKYANLMYETGKIDEANNNLNKCAELLEKMGDKKELANTYFDIAKLYKGISKEDEFGFYTKGIDLFREIGLIEN